MVLVFGLWVDIGTSFLLHIYAGLKLPLSVLLGFIFGTLVNYVLHQKWTFDSSIKELSIYQARNYFCVALISLDFYILANVDVLKELNYICALNKI